MTSGRIVIADRATLPRRAAEWLAAAIGDAVRARGRCSLALAGGTTPRPVYAALAAPQFADEVACGKVDVYFGDERAVPPDHPESNYRMAQDTLLARVPLPARQVHRMESERADLEAAAADYDRLLPAALDVLLLGVGPDGHTASLFPGSTALAERHRRVVVAHNPTPPSLRLTITPPVIATARTVAVLATGDEKAWAVSRALAGDAPASEIPAALARRGVWFVDTGAAARLARPVA